MKKTLPLLLAATLAGGSYSAYAQITLKQDYKNNTAAPIGTFQQIQFKEGGFSTLFPIANTDGKEFWTCSDRGVNVDCSSANPAACHPTYDKMFCFPAYAPKIHRIKLNGDSVQVLQTITMKRPDGTTATGVLNPAGFGSKDAEKASTDTVLDCSAFATKIAAKDQWALDPEGLVVDKNNNFWISEENGPTIWKMDASGKALARYTPYASQTGSASIDIQIDTVFKTRKNNRGFESMAMAPNGKLYTIIQSPLLNPSKTIGESTEVHRMLEIDPVTNATRMFAYLNEGVIGASGPDQIRMSDWKIGDMAAVNDSTFLVIEAATRGNTVRKNIYLVNIAQATPITSALYNGKTVEALVDSAGLAGEGIKAIRKKLFIDLTANGWPAELDKSEGLAIINDSTLAVGNDNDFGQVCPNADGIAIATGTLSHVLVYGLKGANKIPNLYTPVTPPTTVHDIDAVSLVRLYPNPATRDAVLEFDLAQRTDISVDVYDIQGRKAAATINRNQVTGSQSIRIAASGFHNGFYMVQLRAGSQKMQYKLVVAR
ncbi:esterase-like activity of phytase family protein [Taibaiella chishuiensis]|uniref:Putative secreted protein (Por secretion system target) n=1 Tax=Taibaiella chishuiensis TaxID=1434707 RepID=A0A2P8CV10_9BACT|nr:esterase-like activity of phytase family protein [Taibaiella chishuiensis]PSK88800.1 putative secreted protein (Por secretion system target) [Taibaiella chishuiensis]